MGDSGSVDVKNVQFQPNDEFLQTLVAMGISESNATESLYFTGNESVEAAVSYFFTNLLKEDTEENNPDESDNYKMTFVVNHSLKMGVGKIAAQVAHACLGLYREMRVEGSQLDALNAWDYHGEKKIVLKGDTTEHLQELHHKAQEAQIPCYLVRDAGHTQIPAGSTTVLSLFGSDEEINAITGTLTLL